MFAMDFHLSVRASTYNWSPARENSRTELSGRVNRAVNLCESAGTTSTTAASSSFVRARYPWMDALKVPKRAASESMSSMVTLVIAEPNTRRFLIAPTVAIANIRERNTNRIAMMTSVFGTVIPPPQLNIPLAAGQPHWIQYQELVRQTPRRDGTS